MNNQHICPECEEPMEVSEAPEPVLRLFWGFEIWRWKTVHTCVDCELERQRERDRLLFDAGFEDGFDRGMEHQDRWGMV